MPKAGHRGASAAARPAAGGVRQRVAALRAAQDHAGAARLLAEALEHAPDRIDLRMDLVRALYDAGEVREARLASHPLEDRARDADTWQKLYALFRAVHDDTRAELVTSGFLVLHPGDEAATGQMLRLLAEQKRPKEAEALIRRLLTSGEPGLPTLRLVCDCQIRLGAHAAAIDTARRGLAIDADDFALHLAIAKAATRARQKTVVARALPDIARLVGRSAPRRVSLAEAQLWSGDAPAALATAAGLADEADLAPRLRLRLMQVQVEAGAGGAVEAMASAIDFETLAEPKLLRNLLRVMAEAVEAVGGPGLRRVGVRAARRLRQLQPSDDEADQYLAAFEKEPDTASPPPRRRVWAFWRS
jgi:hypothetical protein